MANDPSASSLYRGINCAASYEIVRTPSEWKPPAVQKAANKGTALHRFLEEVGIGVPYVTALERVPEEWRGLASKINIPRVIPFGGEHEVAWKWNSIKRESTILGKSKGRDYGDLSMCETPGTVDWYKIDGDSALIRDYKTGTWSPEPIEGHSQLRFFALQVSETYPLVKNIRVELVWIDKQGNDNIVGADVNKRQIQQFSDDLLSMQMARVSARKSLKQGLELNVNEGPWCRYCPSFKPCPIKSAKREARKKKKDVSQY